ncbi:heat shock 70 kDa protein 12B-like [Mercenaria mercenaria]|uniref:heat shock 70 kDa protein 12B-like n=1 Tax=Mercenaria mercenaria TaxID=6596 RepID=UPI00234EFD11|nr:heat shock 70 kDa protein 12B-like [Mercenaria mercenaria]
MIVAAIDFGTTYSGWAFSFRADYERDPRKAEVKHWHSGIGTLVTVKTPTWLLVKPDGVTFQAFGYEAEDQYMELADNNEHRDYYYFRRFKMLLFGALGKHLTNGIIVMDEMGKELLAVDVFAMSIKFMVDDLMAVVNQRLTGIIMETDIQWVLTVPAIWSDPAKQFMRHAAIKAGITTEKLTIVLEPEAASLYCRHLPVDTTVSDGSLTISEFPTGSKYIVLDAGGGTIDFTVHEVQSQYSLREVRAANGGDWGGTMVDKAFENFLIDLAGETVFNTFKHSETVDWLHLSRDFELKKQAAGTQSEGNVFMHFPVSLIDLFETEQERKITIKDAIVASKYGKTVELKRDKLKISHSTVEKLFEDSIQQIVKHVQKLMKDERMADVKAILMVGGYSESPLLQRAVKSALPGINIVIPQEASSAVFRGALIFGHNPITITERVLKYTYGINVFMPFVDGKHPENKRRKTDTGDRCGDIFHKLIEKELRVTPGETQVKKYYTSAHKKQAVMRFDIFISEEKTPTYVDDKGCTKIGTIEIDFEDPDDLPGRRVSLTMLLGGTEIIVELEDEKTGKKVINTAEFWAE